MKKILSILSIVAAAVMMTVCVSCKKESSANPQIVTVDFRNASTDYIESFLGKDESFFLSEAEKCGMIKEVEGEERKFGRFRNSILGISADYEQQNGKIINIRYFIEDQKDENKSKNYGIFKNHFNNLNKKNYSAFKATIGSSACFKDIKEFSSKLEMTDYIEIDYVKNSNVASVEFYYKGDISHTPHGDFVLNYVEIEFTSPEDTDWYNFLKEYIISPCNE